MNIGAKKGDKVVFNHPDNGHEHDQKTASTFLFVGGVYCVEKTVTSEWHTNVYLDQFPNVAFNSVMFDDYKEE